MFDDGEQDQPKSDTGAEAWTRSAPWGFPAPPPPAPPAPPPRRRRGVVVLAGVLASILLLASGLGVGWALTRGSASTLLSRVSGSSGSADTGLNVQGVAGK